MFPSRNRDSAAGGEAAPREGLLRRFGRALGRTRGALRSGIAGLFSRGGKVDGDLLDEVESLLLRADVGVDASECIVDGLRGLGSDAGPDAVLDALRASMLAILEPVAVPLPRPEAAGPFVILVVGVNGAGKTTTIGKLARRFLGEGRSVMLAAGDTFRAAAIEQLQAWGARNDIPVVAQHPGADSASVVFDALEAARARGVDVLIADTAGRLHTQAGLMQELAKVKRVLGRLDPGAPHETLLVLDAGTGQNALVQARTFHEAIGITGLALTKLDGTAKGGIVLAMAQALGVPIRFVGVGEGLDDLRAFDAGLFVEALVGNGEP